MPNFATQESHDKQDLLSNGLYDVETINGLQERGVAPGVIKSLIQSNPTKKPEEIISMAEELAKGLEQAEADAKANADNTPVQSMPVHIVEAPKAAGTRETRTATPTKTPQDFKNNPHANEPTTTTKGKK